MNTPPIENASLFTEIYGHFPTFHDAEIIDISLDRNTTPSEDFPTVSLCFKLHGWEMTSELTESGHYKLVKHHLITFRFDGVDQVDLRHFNHQNALFGLQINEIKKPSDHALLEVVLESSFGLECSFRAIKGFITEVAPCDENGNKIKG